MKVGAWKNYDELERSMSLPEIISTLEEISESDYGEKRFLAALQGVSMDDNETKETEQEVMERIVATANTLLNGGNPTSQDEIERHKFAQMGLDYETM